VVEVDVICEWSGFEGEGHTLHYHFLIEMGCAKGGLAEASMKARNVSSCSCLTSRRDNVVV